MNYFCSICQNNIDKTKIKTLSCDHSFCKLCIDTWKNKNNNSCPNCRTHIIHQHRYNLRNRNLRSHDSNNSINTPLHNDRFNDFINVYLEFNENTRQTRMNSKYLRNILVTQEIKSKLKELAIANSNTYPIHEKLNIINHIVLILKHNNWIYTEHDRNKAIIQNRFKFIKTHSSCHVKQKVDEWYYQLFHTQIN
tara:strand:+ start:96 stop:677 length:582 start_codon:yes stop_codon:yes gene_type:complete